MLKWKNLGTYLRSQNVLTKTKRLKKLSLLFMDIWAIIPAFQTLNDNLKKEKVKSRNFIDLDKCLMNNIVLEFQDKIFKILLILTK